MWFLICSNVFKTGVFGVVYDGYLSNAEDEPEGTTPVIIKTVKGTDIMVRQSYKNTFCGCLGTSCLFLSMFITQKCTLGAVG